MTQSAEQPSIIKQILAEAADEEKPLVSKQLAELTDIKKDDLAFFDQAWIKLSPKRQLQLISRLIEMAEDSAELNFDAIFRHRLHDPGEEIRAKAIEGLWENEDLAYRAPDKNDAKRPVAKSPLWRRYVTRQIRHAGGT